FSFASKINLSARKQVEKRESTRGLKETSGLQISAVGIHVLSAYKFMWDVPMFVEGKEQRIDWKGRRNWMEKLSPALTEEKGDTDRTVVASTLQITEFVLKTNAACFLSDKEAVNNLPVVANFQQDGSLVCNDPPAQVLNSECYDEQPSTSKMEVADLSCVLSNSNASEVRGERDSLSGEDRQMKENSCFHSFSSEGSSINNEEFLSAEANSSSNSPSFSNVEKSNTDLETGVNFKKSRTWESNMDLEPVPEVFVVAEDLYVEDSNGCESSSSPMLTETPQEKIIRTMSTQCSSHVDTIPLWGFTSICGRRPEMEDAVATVPCFDRLPYKLFMGGNTLNGVSHDLSQTVHFYGVYDGHGGCQVANYCRERLHLALAEEIEVLKEELQNGSSATSCQEQWEKAFIRCFVKVDEEVRGVRQPKVVGDGSEARTDPIAPETVGSTAVAAIVCSTHIIVANCGDSRAVLCRRGKAPLPLSDDHKPDRKDEWDRIEAAGGKVIQWNGYRVFGVLAMSRSIGDGYFKPCVIADPEVMFVPRAKDDDLIILATDGLWDVMTNEEACDAARKRILVWHKKNGGGAHLTEDRGKSIDPAAQAAADYLSKLASQKGSKDNISVIVVDLKPQRKLKIKS
ncbi:hypothetical protein V2J09_003211, partial [Rumex salicifolius]